MMLFSPKTKAAVLLAGAFIFLPLTGSQADERKELILSVDKAHLYRLEQSASTVIIGNPTIADVNIQDGNLLVLTGKNFGATNIIVLDDNDKEIAELDVSVKIAGTGSLTVYKGASKSSYNCSPVCENSLSVGDNKDNFDLVKKQMEEKMSISKEGSASEPSSDE